MRSNLREAQVELRDLRELQATREELEGTREELELLRRAHEAQARHLISERLSFADQTAELDSVIDQLREEVEWRKGVMEEYERQLQSIQNSRSFRYTAPIRRIMMTLRGNRG
jgi:hypothetical protein